MNTSALPHRFAHRFAASWSPALLAALLPAALLTGCVAASDEEPSAESTEANAVTGTPVAQHGQLKIVGSELKDAHGTTVQLKGMSMFWSQWSGQFWNSSVVNTLSDEWHATVVRAAMGIESGGYLENPGAEKARLKTVVDAAINKGLYVIIDWHDHNATQHTAQSKAFFSEMAQTYGNKPNVLFEIYNEPAGPTWPQVKSYAEDVIGAIRGAGANNVVIVGTPTWSQDVDQAANNPITKFQNVAYTLHFYANSHKQPLRDKASYAMSKGIALFVTEWGTCDASGNSGLNLDESQTWLNFLDQHHLSWANWSLNDKAETASALNPGASGNGHWADSALTASGKFVKSHMGGGSTGGGSTGGGSTGGGSTGGGGSAAFQFSVSGNINPWWLQVHVDEPGHSVKSVTANVNGKDVGLTLQSWGDWAVSPSSAVPKGARVVFTATDERGQKGSVTSQPWPG